MPGKVNEISVKSVQAAAKRLRDRADTAEVANPGSPRLYAPSKDTAYKLSATYGPERALTELATRNRAREMVIEEDGARASAARHRHLLHQLEARGAVDAELALLTPGVRLDRALFVLGLVSDAPASRPPDADQVMDGGRESSPLPSGRRDRERVLLVEDVRRLVLRVERMAESARRRVVEREAA